MATGKMHEGEVDTDIRLVRRLLAAQFPRWADLPLSPVRSAGTDHALYRLGDDKVVRLPRIGWAVPQLDKEHEWLPRLAPHLPLAVPVPLAKGAPGEGYPWPWSVYPWLDGNNATLDRLTYPHQTARDLTSFIQALQRLDAANGPTPGEHNFFRGEPLARRNARTREVIAELDGQIDTRAVTDAWDDALQAPVWGQSPVWVHGDLQAGNLLQVAGQLRAVIDFGGLGIGDPAADLIAAWNLFDADTRTTFRHALGVDEATWLRGRGWALTVALVALPYYQHTNPPLAAVSRRTIAEVLADHSRGG